MGSVEAAHGVLNWLLQQGCEEVVICPGGRNAPFVDLLSKTQKFNKVYSLFDERAAGFFALGRIKKDLKPVAVITTSGTAAAELIPSAIEAHYGFWPLIFITCDRPESYRGTGAPQTIDQTNLMSKWTQADFDLQGDLSSLLEFDLRQELPVHINVCLDEPLLYHKKDLSWVNSSPNCKLFSHRSVGETKDRIQIKNPIVMVGGLRQYEKKVVQNFLH